MRNEVTGKWDPLFVMVVSIPKPLDWSLQVRSCARPSDWGRGPAAVPGACWACLSQLHFPLPSFGLRAYKSFSLLGWCWRELGSVHLRLRGFGKVVHFCLWSSKWETGTLMLKGQKHFRPLVDFSFVPSVFLFYFTKYLIPTLGVLSSPFPFPKIPPKSVNCKQGN